MPQTVPATEPTVSAAPIRAGIFATVDAAQRAVQGLLDAGFTKQEITVICATDSKEAHFREYEHHDPAAPYAGSAGIVGGAIGATLGALTVLGGVLATGGLGLLAAGGIVAAVGGVSGTFVGIMLTRGVEKEVADFYEQELLGGNLLVSVEKHGPDAAERLETAARVIAAAGAKPLPLAD